MKTTIRRSMAMAIAAAMILSATGIYAGGARDTTEGEANRGAHFKKMTEELRLTPQQKEALDKDRVEFTAKSKDLRDKMQAARTGLKQELDKPTPDKGRIDTLASELKALAGQQIQNRIDKVMAMKRILTPEQFSKMKSSMDSHKKDKNGKHGYKDEVKGGHSSPDTV